MSAPVSSTSTGQFGLAKTLFASNVQIDRGFSADSSATSFSDTLKSRMEKPNTPEPGSHLDSAEPQREPQRPAERTAESRREPERQNTGKAEESSKPRDNADGSKADGAAPAKEGQAAGKDAQQATASGETGKETEAAQGGTRAGATAAEEAGDAAAAALTTDFAALLATADVADEADAATDDGSDAAADAALPVDLAALLPQLAATRAAEGSAGLDPAVDDSQDISLQNSALLPRTDAGTPGAGRGTAAQIAVLQAQQATVAAAAGRLAAGVQGADGGDGAQATQLPGNAASQQLGEFAQLRSQAIAARSTTPQLAVNTPVGQDGWAEEVGNRVTWMLGRAESKAELVLTPPNLGKLEVSINLNGDQTTAQFVANSQAARNALEQALPRLREMFAEAGISLGETSVSTSGEQQTGRDGGSGGSGRGQGGGSVGDGTTASVWSRQHDGMVDTFV